MSDKLILIDQVRFKSLLNMADFIEKYLISDTKLPFSAKIARYKG